MKKLLFFLAGLFTVFCSNAITVYFVNNVSWSKVCIYTHTPEQTGSWNDYTSMTVKEGNLWVYHDNASKQAQKVMFNNGNSGNGNQYPNEGGFDFVDGAVYDQTGKIADSYDDWKKSQGSIEAINYTKVAVKACGPSNNWNASEAYVEKTIDDSKIVEYVKVQVGNGGNQGINVWLFEDGNQVPYQFSFSGDSDFGVAKNLVKTSNSWITFSENATINLKFDFTGDIPTVTVTEFSEVIVDPEIDYSTWEVKLGVHNMNPDFWQVATPDAKGNVSYKNLPIGDKGFQVIAYDKDNNKEHIFHKTEIAKNEASVLKEVEKLGNIAIIASSADASYDVTFNIPTATLTLTEVVVVKPWTVYLDADWTTANVYIYKNENEEYTSWNDAPAMTKDEETGLWKITIDDYTIKNSLLIFKGNDDNRNPGNNVKGFEAKDGAVYNATVNGIAYDSVEAWQDARDNVTTWDVYFESSDWSAPRAYIYDAGNKPYISWDDAELMVKDDETGLWKYTVKNFPSEGSYLIVYEKSDAHDGDKIWQHPIYNDGGLPVIEGAVYNTSSKKAAYESLDAWKAANAGPSIAGTYRGTVNQAPVGTTDEVAYPYVIEWKGDWNYNNTVTFTWTLKFTDGEPWGLTNNMYIYGCVPEASVTPVDGVYSYTSTATFPTDKNDFSFFLKKEYGGGAINPQILSGEWKSPVEEIAVGLAYHNTNVGEWAGAEDHHRMYALAGHAEVGEDILFTHHEALSEIEDGWNNFEVSITPADDYASFIGGVNKNAVAEAIIANDGTAAVNVKAYTAGIYNLTVKNNDFELNGKKFLANEVTVPVRVSPSVQGVGLAFNWQGHQVTKENGELVLNLSKVESYEEKSNNGNVIRTWTKGKCHIEALEAEDGENLEIWYKYGETNNDVNTVNEGPAYVAAREASALDLAVNANPEPAAEGYTQYKDYASAPDLTKSNEISFIIKQNGIVGKAQTVKLLANVNDSDVETGVEGVEAVEDAEVVYFDLNGVRVNAENLSKGLYIAVKASKAEKVLVK